MTISLFADRCRADDNGAMTFTHVVAFRWKENTDPAAVEQVTRALSALAARMDGVESYLCGSDVGMSQGAYDYAIVGRFAGRDEFVAYRDHPEHQRILKELIVPALNDRVVVQLEG